MSGFSPRADVDLGSLRHNLESLRRCLQPGCQVLAAVKANGYGHGVLPVARTLEANGVNWFGVATPEEALELREGGVEGRILLFGPAFERIEELLEAGVDLTVPSREALEAILRCRAASEARIHLKVDSGMGRLGHRPEEALELARAIDGSEGMVLEGAWTHFARADEAERAFTEQQIERFEEFLGRLERDGIHPGIVHACNSAGVLAYPRAHYDMVRPGISLYGYPPGPDIASLAADLLPVMTLSAPVTFVKRIGAGTPISYGGTWRAQADTTIATVRLGYADGYPRLLGNRGWATVHDKRAPIVGRICMDQLMLDVGEGGAEPGDRAVLFGSGGPSAAEVGALVDTVSYEMLTSVSSRVERVYHE